MLLDCTASVGGKSRAVKIMCNQVTWLQLVLPIFRLDRDNNKRDCCQQAAFLIGNALTLWERLYVECMLSSRCGVMRNNANTFGNCVPGCCVSVSLIIQISKNTTILRGCACFHVESIKPIVLTKSSGKTADLASLDSSGPGLHQIKAQRQTVS